MNYHNITTDDMLNGEGLRTVLWVAGCNHGCKNCHNPITWDAAGGVPFDENVKKELFEKIAPDYISGVTFSGGDPLFPANRKTILNLAKEIKITFPNKTIWLYTGYSWEDVSHLPVMEYIDIVVDGRFIEELKNIKLHWKGSSNQRVIHVKNSLALKHCIIYHPKGEKDETNSKISQSKFQAISGGLEEYLRRTAGALSGDIQQPALAAQSNERFGGL